jgi:hypothetical protein
MRVATSVLCLWSGCVLSASDVDGDGFAVPADCDDWNASISPAEEDQPRDAVDQDCDGADVLLRATGADHDCVLRTDGLVRCEGDNSHGQLEGPAGTVFVQLVAGDFHTCGLTPDGEALCWGDDAFGQSSPPVDGGPYREIGAGPDFTWGREDHGIWSITRCWGLCGAPLPD